MNRILVNGAGGFIGGHMVRRLKAEGLWVRGADIKPHDFSASPADEFLLGDCEIGNSRPRSSKTSRKSTSLPPTWAAPDTSSPASMTLRSCTTLP